MTSAHVEPVFADGEQGAASDRRGIRIAALDEAPALEDTLTEKLRDMGSNAWAIGTERSENGKGYCSQTRTTLGTASRPFGEAPDHPWRL